MTLLHRLNAFLSSAKLLHFVLPIVMAYLVVGTIAQKYIGLYQATQTYFAAPIYWLGGIVPLPGMPVFIALIFLNLAFKLFFCSPWVKRNAGIILTHIGALMLLLGGLFTALFSSEGYMALGVGEQSNTVSDYHVREFVILDQDGQTTALFNHKNIQEGQIIAPPHLPFTITVLEQCDNCQIIRRQNPTEAYEGMAQFMQLTPKPSELNNEENMAGLTFRVRYNTPEEKPREQVFVTLEDVPKIPSIEVKNNTYSFVLRREQRILPFSITLLDFEKEVHPGTEMAKEYQSTVRVQDGDLQWESVISMNEPLRYKGYTFFQSSFLQTPKGDVSVLAVVWNVGRAFPYISGITMCIGLILHLFMRRRKKREKADA